MFGCLASTAVWLWADRVCLATHYTQIPSCQENLGSLSEEADVEKIVISQAGRIAGSLQPNELAPPCDPAYISCSLKPRPGIKKEPFAYGQSGREYASVVSFEKSWKQDCVHCGSSPSKLAQVSQPYLVVRDTKLSGLTVFC